MIWDLRDGNGVTGFYAYPESHLTSDKTMASILSLLRSGFDITLINQARRPWWRKSEAEDN